MITAGTRIRFDIEEVDFIGSLWTVEELSYSGMLVRFKKYTEFIPFEYCDFKTISNENN